MIGQLKCNNCEKWEDKDQGLTLKYAGNELVAYFCVACCQVPAVKIVLKHVTHPEEVGFAFEAYQPLPS